jgi:hypothetical protein
VVVPVTLVGRVAMAVVDVVDVSLVRHCDVAAVWTVLMLVFAMNRVCCFDALIYMITVFTVDVRVVHVVGVVLMGHCDVAAAFTVDV